jgi:hypothetical protein
MTAALPAFITKGTKVKLKTARKRAAKAAERFTGDTGTREMRQHQPIVLEARQRSLRGEPTVVGARVEAQLPHDRYRVRNQLDPQTPWKNERYWDAAERLRRDFHESGLSAKMCSSFEPRVSGGDGALAPDKAIEAMKRYKKAMNSIGPSLRPVLWYVCIAGQTTEEWAIRNGKKPSEGMAVFRCGLAELAHFYGYVKLDSAEPA